MGGRRQGLRPVASDHLAALAGRFHPERAPTWDWETHTWWWIGPDGRRQVLGDSWSSAHLALDRLGHRITCAHGAPLVGGPCPSCREAIRAQMASSSAA